MTTTRNQAPTRAHTRDGHGRQADAGDGDGRDRQAADRQDSRKVQVLTRHSASSVRSIADAVVIKDGEPFFLCPPDGQIPVARDHGYGLYHHDTRFLNGYELDVGGVSCNALAATAVSGSRAVLELTTPEIQLGDGKAIAKDRLAIRWIRELDGRAAALHDRIELHNFDTDGARLPVRLRFGAGFEDVFEVRGLLDERPGTLHEPAWDGDRLVFRYDGKDGVIRTLTVSTDRKPKRRHGPGFEIDVDVPPRGDTRLEVTLQIAEQVDRGVAAIERRTQHEPGARPGPRHPTTADDGPADRGWPVAVTSDSITLNAALSRSLDDLITLRGELDGHRYYAAGVPWFSTLFGRDSLIAAYQTLAFDPAVAAETLRLLAGRQGLKDDEFRDEQPGRILHELRIGELARLHEIPHTPYFGSIDSTPLFLVVLARHAAWTGSLDLFRELRPNVERALAWIDGPADPDGRGWVAYQSAVRHGLVNQGWKDSGDAIVRADGSLAEPPIALPEVQGYVYAAKRELADLFERAGEPRRADALREQADALRQRFERAFWSDDLGSYVLALDKGGRCEVATSNAGQVLWSGIAGPGHARAVARRLLGDDLFGGWGIRTLSSAAVAFNPIGYHLGTVWPHDNGLIAEGFRRYGHDEAAERVFVALVEASTDFPQQRLPECFAGYARSDFGIPVRYPVACHPQAWAAGAIPHLLTSVLGLAPDAFEGRLRVVRPRLPGFLRHLELRDLRIGRARVDLDFDRTNGRTEATVVGTDGELEVEIEPAS